MVDSVSNNQPCDFEGVLAPSHWLDN